MVVPGFAALILAILGVLLIVSVLAPSGMVLGIALLLIALGFAGPFVVRG